MPHRFITKCLHSAIIGRVRRFRAIALVAGACAIAAVTAGQLTGRSPGRDVAGRPNIVFLLTDDQTVEQMKAMPRTRGRIGDAGATFRESYVSYPLCCPSRATQLTGQYAHNDNVLQDSGPMGGYHNLDGGTTVAVALQSAGYRTVQIGKYLNGYGFPNPTEVPPGWDDWYAPTKTAQSGVYYRWYLNHNGTISYYGSSPSAYKTDVLQRIAVRNIHAVAENHPDQPFFLNVAFPAPHWPPTPAPGHANDYTDAPLPMPPNFNEADMSDKAQWLQDVTFPLTPKKIDLIRSRYRKRLATLVSTDIAVNEIVNALADVGKLSNTYVIFASDNGFFTGEHRIIDGKYLPYEPSARVPLMIRGPGIPAGERSNELVSNVDWGPTILDVADAAPRTVIDGRSLLPYAEDGSLRTDRPLLFESLRWHSGHCDAADATATGAQVSDLNQDQPRPKPGHETGRRTPGLQAKGYHAIRVRRYMLIEYSNCERELYDMREDPHQLHAKHRGDRRYSSVFNTLLAELNQLSQCAGDSCRQDTSPLVSR